MATIPARRKHGACFLRIRENCPFRKLRKNRCYDVTTASSAGGGVRWTDFSEHPISAADDRPISTINVAPLQPVPNYQSLCPQHQPQGPVAMDMEEVRAPAPNMDAQSLRPSSALGPGPRGPDLRPPNQHRRSALAEPSEARMGEFPVFLSLTKYHKRCAAHKCNSTHPSHTEYPWIYSGEHRKAHTRGETIHRLSNQQKK